MENDISVLFSMTKEELKKKILSFNLNDNEQKIFDKIVKVLNELDELNSEESKAKVSRDVAMYIIYKQKGGK